MCVCVEGGHVLLLRRQHALLSPTCSHGCTLVCNLTLRGCNDPDMCACMCVCVCAGGGFTPTACSHVLMRFLHACVAAGTVRGGPGLQTAAGRSAPSSSVLLQRLQQINRQKKRKEESLKKPQIIAVFNVMH